MAIEHEILDDNLETMVAKLIAETINPETHTIEHIAPLAIDFIGNYKHDELTIRNLYRVTLKPVAPLFKGSDIHYITMTRSISFNLRTIQTDIAVSSMSDIAIHDNNAMLKFSEQSSSLLYEIGENE